MQQAVPPQQKYAEPQAVFPQHLFFAVRQNGVVPVVQQNWLLLQLLLPQHTFPVVTQNGVVPVVQHVDFLPVQAGVQVACA